MKINIAVLLIAILLFWKCSPPVNPDDHHVYNITLVSEADSLELAWDPPEIPSGSIATYELYYRHVNKKTWTLLHDSITTPKATIYHNQIGDGTFELAVRTVISEDEKSDYHKSTDENAIPNGGWFLKWN